MSELAVVILNYNGRQHLETFLPSVCEFSTPHQIIVADNCSTDDSVQFLKEKFPQVSILNLEKNTGYSGGYNRALQKVKAKHAVLLNSDVEVTKGWIEPILRVLNSEEKIVACQPKILSLTNKGRFEYAGAAGGFIDSLAYPFCRGRLFDHLEDDLGQYDDERQVFWATGACLAVKLDAFNEVGMFDEDFFAHMEEIDLCWRFNRAGYKVMYTGMSHVFHLGGGTLNKYNPRKTYLNFRNGLAIMLKNESRLALIWKLPLRIILDWIAAARFLLRQPTHSLAVVKAQLHFTLRLPSTLRKRE